MKQFQLQILQNSISSIEDAKREKSLKLEIEDLLDREELMWAQKARTKWFLQGDRNTNYFQILVKQRRARSRILHIKDDQGKFTDKPDEIETILSCHFRENYVSRNNISVEDLVQELDLPIPTFYDQDYNLLTQSISNMEVEDKGFQLGPYKALGPNDIPAFFFHEFQPIVKADVINTVQAFFHPGSLFKPFNHTFITLIPKVTFPKANQSMQCYL